MGDRLNVMDIRMANMESTMGRFKENFMSMEKMMMRLLHTRNTSSSPPVLSKPWCAMKQLQLAST